MKYKKRYKFSFLLLIILLNGVSCFSKNTIRIPDYLRNYITSVEWENIGSSEMEINFHNVSDNLTKVTLVTELKDSVFQDDWQINITPAFSPVFHWASHLTPTHEHIIAQHVFRAPAVIVSTHRKKLSLIPDLDILKQGTPVDWYMDMDALENEITLGMSSSEVKEHVLFVRKPGAVFPRGKVTFGFYILISDEKKDLINPFRDVTSFLWEKWGENTSKTTLSGFADLEKYVEHTYNWAFGSWRKSVWQEFNLNGTEVGSPVFIVNVSQSPNFPGIASEREFLSIWNQAWFSSLRSASGLYRYARHRGNKVLLDYALKTKELALAFPQKNGFFPGLIATQMEKVEIDGKIYKRSKGWNSHYFGNSNRNPYTRDIGLSPMHILDMSFTANQMLLWYSELEQDKRLLSYTEKYADALIQIQDEEGFFPAWLNNETFEPMHHLNRSPESSMSVTFLLNLYNITQNEKYRCSALKAMEAIINHIVYTGQWEDFETYWSCSPFGRDDLVGKKIERNNQYKQNTLSIYWTAEALLKSYHVTGDKKYLKLGERTLDEMLMYQSCWQPPYIFIRALGGFGVMNADGEWTDARQSLFAELIIQYGIELQRDEYTERGIAALYASFEMMYCPENVNTKRLYEKTWPFFNEKDFGFMMENYGHNGITSVDGVGIGEFTIYDWGNGAASEAYNRIVDHYGKKFLVAGN